MKTDLKNKIINGDSLEELKKIPSETFDLIFADPPYDQKNIKSLKKTNALYPVISPNHDAAGMWIHQDAWFHLGDFNQKTTVPYSLHKQGNGVYAFMIEGRASIEGESLEKRDALGVWETESFSITAEENSRILLVEVPMKL